MTQNEIIRMAREAGGDPLNSTGEPICFRAEGLKRFAALVSAHEREACAKVCEETNPRAYMCIEAIRARGEK